MTRSPRPPEPGSATPPWRPDPPLRPGVPEGADHGYVLGDRPHPCTREELAEWVRAYPGTPGVWSPETPGAVRPEEVPWLVEALRGRRVEEAQQHLGMAALATLGLGGVLFVLLPSLDPAASPGTLLLCVLVAFWLLDSLYDLYRAGRVGAAAFAQQRQNERHAAWAYARPAPFTRVLVGALGVVFLAEGFRYERAAAAAGLVEEAVRAGEWWRLLTGPMLHAGTLHLLMNLAALLVLGRFVEVHASWPRLAQVFLLSAVAGSVCSLFLTPGPSLGASGGIMGLVGFLGARARRRPEEFPDDFLHRIRYAVGATALLGVLGFAFVDNWAHLGGLLAGVALGWVLDGPPGEGDRSGAAAGWAALAVVLAACAWAVARLLGLAPAAV